MRAPAAALTLAVAGEYGPRVPTSLYLIRHGVTAWHKEGRMLGQRDIPLDADGMAQAEELADALGDAPLREIVSSPMIRAVQTAEVLGRRRNIEVARDPRLGDLRIAAWEGRATHDVHGSAEWRRMIAIPEERAPGGESLRELAGRARGAIDQILADNPAGDALAVVTHGTVIRAVVLGYLEAPLESFESIDVAPGSITSIVFHGASPRINVVGWVPTLGRNGHA
jgi:broad specificity phosphatase PhoE